MRKLNLPPLPPQAKKLLYQCGAVVLGICLAWIATLAIYSLISPFFD